MLYSTRYFLNSILLVLIFLVSTNANSCETLESSDHHPAMYSDLIANAFTAHHLDSKSSQEANIESIHSRHNAQNLINSPHEECECCNLCTCISCTGCSASCGTAVLENNLAAEFSYLPNECLPELPNIYSSLIPSLLEHPPK